MGFVSAGVYTNIIDLSLYAQRLASTVCGAVGTASKGPVDTPTLITNMGQYIETFGRPMSPLGYFAEEFFKEANQLWVTRVGDAGLEFATRMLVDREATPADTIEVSATSKGTWGNDLQVEVLAGTNANSFKLNVYQNVNGYVKLVEYYDNLVMDSSSAYYCETVVNGVSPFITLADQGSASTPPADLPALDASGAVSLASGDNGLTAPNYVGTIAVDGTRTGLQTLAAVESLDLNLLAVPGISTETVVHEIVDVVETRGDCLGAVDHPFGLTPQEQIEWTNGEGGHGNTTALNSKYITVFCNWVEVHDQYAGVPDATIWLPPSAFVCQRAAYTDTVRDPWWAIAGLNRGRIPHAIDVENLITKGEMEAMYGYPNICNPIAKFKKLGVVLWGNRTGQREPSATDRIPVMRMLLQAMKIIATATQYMTFEPNDPTTWRQFERLTNPFLRHIKDSRGLYEFHVQMDNTTNTTHLVNNNVMNGRIYLKPTKTAEVINIDFVLTETGAKFEDLLGTSL